MSCVIPKSVTNIGYDAFRSCINLKSIIIPIGVQTIEEYAFSGCPYLNIYCEALREPAGWDNRWNYSNRPVCYGFNIDNYVLIDGIEYIVENESATILRMIGTHESVVVPSVIEINGNQYPVTKIGASAFSLCLNLKKVVLSDNIMRIEEKAFYECNNLTDFTSSKNIEYIGAEAFFKTNIQIFDFYNGLLYIGDRAFGSSKLENVVLPNTLNEIRDNVFESCDNLKSVVVSEGVTSIGSYAFSNCSNLTEITLPSSLENIKHYAFSYCSSLVNLIISEKVQNIGDNAFNGCSSLVNITLPNSLTKIGNHLFNYCINLNSIIIPEGVTSIGNYAFRNCSNLVNVLLPNSLTIIGSDAFLNCGKLSSIIIPKNVSQINSTAFWNCNSLTIYCEASGQQSGWNNNWKQSSIGVYYAGEWEYVDGVPTPIV